jgi:hypothetical protein
VDRADDAYDPNYGRPNDVVVTIGGNKGGVKPSVLYDAPGVPERFRNSGSEFITFAVSRNPGKKGKLLGYVHWGFYYDNEGKLSPLREPFVGADGHVPDQFRDAIERWNSFKNLQNANIDIP